MKKKQIPKGIEFKTTVGIRNALIYNGKIYLQITIGDNYRWIEYNKAENQEDYLRENGVFRS